jgi:hypothetical protein
MPFQVLGAGLFVGTGGALTLNAAGIGDDEIDTSGATGFSVTGASFSLASVTTVTDSFIGIEATVSDASLVGI